MGLTRRLLVGIGISLSSIVGIMLSTTQVEALWTFDATPPSTIIAPPQRGSNITTFQATISDNNFLRVTNKEFFFLVSPRSITGNPGPLSNYPNNCPSRITPQNSPCLISIIGQPGIIQGLGGNLIATQSNIDFSANNQTYYIYGKLLQDEVGNAGLWSAPETFTPTAPPADPFLQTTEGDVHSNEGINTTTPQ